MGFFDRLKKIINKVSQEEPRRQETPKPQVRPVETHVYQAKKDQNYFRGVLRSLFGSYEIEENKNLDAIGGTNQFSFNYISFILKDGRSVKGVVQLIETGRKGKNRPYIQLRDFCKANEIPYLAFYLHQPNEDGYVRTRISRAIR